MSLTYNTMLSNICNYCVTDFMIAEGIMPYIMQKGDQKHGLYIALYYKCRRT